MNRNRFIELARGEALGLLCPKEREELKKLQEKRRKDATRSQQEIDNDKRIEQLLKNLS